MLRCRKTHVQQVRNRKRKGDQSCLKPSTIDQQTTSMNTGNSNDKYSEREEERNKEAMRAETA